MDYLYRRPYLAAIQRIIDSFGYLLRRTGRTSPPVKVNKILVSRIDHLGDVFLASSILPHLKRAYPGAKIHFLAGEWAWQYLRSNPSVDAILAYNSLRHNRSRGFIKNAFKALAGFVKNVRVMRSERYDICIDLRAYPFNSIPLLYLGGGGFKVGFSTGGFGFLLDRIVPYRFGVHELEHIRDVLVALGIDMSGQRLSPVFTPSESAVKEGTGVLEGLGIREDESFVLIHTGSGTPSKHWTRDGWQGLVDSINREYGLKVLLYDTASGDSIKGCIKLPVLISFAVYAVIAERASLFVGLDSLPAHLAASFGVPAVVVWCGISDPRQWRPLGEKVGIVVKELPCAPCYRKNGCSSMECMDISVEDCMRELQKIFPSPKDRSHAMRVHGNDT
jgi:ADP-heptose:LPS heptosyltransferase